MPSAIFFDAAILFAQVPSVTSPEFWNGFVSALLFGLLGIVLLLTGFYLFELVTRKLDVEEELKKGNVAVGIVVAGLLLAVAYIAATAIH